jgi:pantoate--beta-alanine ligase
LHAQKKPASTPGVNWQSGEKAFVIHIFRAISRMRGFPADLRRSGKAIACVPTMGFLHQGHVSLMEKASHWPIMWGVSIFVNPTLFGPAKTWVRVPKTKNGIWN